MMFKQPILCLEKTINIQLYIYICMYVCMYVYRYILNKKTQLNFLQIFLLFTKPSTVCVDKALDEKFTHTAEN